MIGWDPKTEVAPSSRQRKKERRKLVVGQISNFGTVSRYTQFYIPSLSQVEERLKTKEKKRRKTFMLMYYPFMIYLIR